MTFTPSATSGIDNENSWPGISESGKASLRLKKLCKFSGPQRPLHAWWMYHSGISRTCLNTWWFTNSRVSGWVHTTLCWKLIFENLVKVVPFQYSSMFGSLSRLDPNSAKTSLTCPLNSFGQMSSVIPPVEQLPETGSGQTKNAYNGFPVLHGRSKIKAVMKSRVCM